jgi:hypothetical protein
MRRRQCQGNPWEAFAPSHDVAQAAHDYAAGYADGMADRDS